MTEAPNTDTGAGAITSGLGAGTATIVAQQTHKPQQSTGAWDLWGAGR